ncbi:MAG TPA: chemotaxis protein CheC [Candidatus Didemnitutus sp.]|nr:chemotaxis protein CheC [Candidatus Didemnitutus sp.]
MELTLAKRDALTELINIGYGRAAGALSELTGYRILLEVPQISLHEIDAIGPMLQDMLGDRVASVNQAFSGGMSGNALLLLDEPSAIALSRLLSEERPVDARLDSNAREIITEVGNILLNACLGVFGNLLRVPVSFAVPQLNVETVPTILGGIAEHSPEPLRFGLMIHTRFRIKTGNVTGYLVIVLGIASLDRLMRELDEWEQRQLQ